MEFFVFVCLFPSKWISNYTETYNKEPRKTHEEIIWWKTVQQDSKYTDDNDDDDDDDFATYLCLEWNQSGPAGVH
jgi:hypothetical protein